MFAPNKSSITEEYYELTRTAARKQQISNLLMSKVRDLKKDAAKLWAKTILKIQSSCYTPHYGKQAAARNLRHAMAGTHGLTILDGSPYFK